MSDENTKTDPTELEPPTITDVLTEVAKIAATMHAIQHTLETLTDKVTELARDAQAANVRSQQNRRRLDRTAEAMKGDPMFGLESNGGE